MHELGQNAFEQARQFSKATQITALAITKLDGTAKGGVVLGICDQMQVPSFANQIDFEDCVHE